MAGTFHFVVFLAALGGCASVVAPTSGPPSVLEASSAAAVDTASALASSSQAPSAAPSASAAPSSVSAAPSSVSAAPSSVSAAPSSVSAAPSSAPSSAPGPTALPGKPARATVGDPKFEGGDVPKAKAALEKLGKAVAKCVTENGGLRAPKGSIEIQFLVRAQGIAEGVDVLSATGVDPDAKKCVRDALKKKTIGPPSNDPVGVTVKIDLETATP